ncbi:hexapeptide transferase [Blastopirellula marina]|uniref:Hexapeptide transferase n=1 Tax=Blastopirellula marina TaxID=124 RepID=A0A2S8G300_9BACT|nr:hexapeptide transferase [Blastopirellula marina]RCS55133.1 hexapeptide transferase [Bremerella cremea]
MTQRHCEVVVVGAGGHAKVCIELLQAMGHEIACCIGGPDSPPSCLGHKVLAGDHNLPNLYEKGYRQAFVAIGANHVRARIFHELHALGFDIVNAISPTAVVSPSSQLGRGIAVMANAVINADSRIGDAVIINTGATVDHDVIVANGVHIAPRCALAGNVQVGERSFLGVGCSIIPEIKIGCDTVVGAGAVVVQDLPDSIVAYGVPARVARTRD